MRDADDGGQPVTGAPRPVPDTGWTRVERRVWRAARAGAALTVCRSLYGHWIGEVSWPGSGMVTGPATRTRLAAQRWCEQTAAGAP